MIFWLMLKLERLVRELLYNMLKDFGFFLEDFFRIICFLYDEIFEFP
jgi:hypothetical protein